MTSKSVLQSGFLKLAGAERREWMGMDGNGGMGLSLTIIMDHSLIPYV